MTITNRGATMVFNSATYLWQVELNGGIRASVKADEFALNESGDLLFFRMGMSGRVMIQAYASGSWTSFLQASDTGTET